MSRFITLPSGLRVNTDHITCFISPKNINGKTVIHLSGNMDPSCVTEDMTAERLDELLNPQQSPIVSPVLELRMPSAGDAVMFTVKGVQKHGIVKSRSISVEHDEYSWVDIASSGEIFRYWPDAGGDADPMINQ